jgi:hypothetical protein
MSTCRDEPGGTKGFALSSETKDRAAAGRLTQPTLVHLPVHASWLNEIEIYFSIVQRKS